ncbi:MAG TPA: GNAT family N-acetyltransferase [Pyrinomonadaceae bacterium]|jgi:CelD/BcsL family acetyltransferase involved in cellulose biosynthesis
MSGISAATTELDYEVLTALPAVAALAPEWDALLARSGCNLAFSSAQWFVAACHARAAQPYVLVARRGAALAGLFPLVVTEDGSSIEFPSYLCDYNDIVTEAEDAGAASGLLAHAAAAARAARSKLALTNLRADSHCLRAATELLRTGAITCTQRRGHSCFYLPLATSFGAYLQTRSRTFRKSLGRAQRAAERNNICVRELDAAGCPPAQLAEIFLSLNHSRFGHDSNFKSPAAQAFVRELFPGLFVEHRLRAFALLAAEKIIALDICMMGRNSLCTWNGGFDAEAARWSPGRLLIGAGIRRAYELQLAEYDLLRGTHSYKASWALATRVLSRIELQLRD